jgi:hypothetical protein
MSTEYIATWQWTGSGGPSERHGKKASLTYGESSVPAAIRALKRAVAEGRATRARLIARTVLYDSAAGIDISPEYCPCCISSECECRGRKIIPREGE